jgi:hypothetical protein
MDYRVFAVHGETRGPGFYLTALRYGNYLWQRGYAARSLLCLDRAFGADVPATDPVLRDWPLPYRAMAWLIASTPPGVFIGTPRVHFQPFADRMNEPRRDIRRWRAWACWEISRVVRPDLPGDPRHRVTEPSRSEITARLDDYGHPGESQLWRESLDYAASLPAAAAKLG